MAKIDIDNKLYRNWSFVLYPLEDETHKNAIDYIHNNFDYAEIVHDKDVNELGELKKIHTHIVITFKNACSAKSLEKKLGIKVGAFNVSTSLKSALLYLVHFRILDKYQYDIINVSGPLVNQLDKYIRLEDRESEDEIVIKLIDYIESYNTYLTKSVFIRYCCSIGCFDVFRRCQYTFISLINEHNTVCNIEEPFYIFDDYTQ